MPSSFKQLFDEILSYLPFHSEAEKEKVASLVADAEKEAGISTDEPATEETTEAPTEVPAETPAESPAESDTEGAADVTPAPVPADPAETPSG